MSRFLVPGCAASEGKSPPSRRHCRGFTLIESMAAVTVLGVLGSIASYLILDSVDQCMAVTTAAQIHAELSVAMDRATRELRRIDLDAGAGGVAPDIESTTSTSIQWEDTDGDDYALALSGSTLTLQVNGGSAQMLLSDVSACTVSTYNEDNTLLGATLSGAGCDPIRRVVLSVTVTRNGVSESLRTKALIRSTMDGDT